MQTCICFFLCSSVILFLVPAYLHAAVPCETCFFIYFFVVAYGACCCVIHTVTEVDMHNSFSFPAFCARAAVSGEMISRFCYDTERYTICSDNPVGDDDAQLVLSAGGDVVWRRRSLQRRVARMLPELCKSWPNRWAENYVSPAQWMKRTLPDVFLPSNMSPFELLSGRRPRTSLDTLVPGAGVTDNTKGLDNFVEQRRQIC